MEYFGFSMWTQQSSAANTHRVALHSGEQQTVKMPFFIGERESLVQVQNYWNLLFNLDIHLSCRTDAQPSRWCESPTFNSSVYFKVVIFELLFWIWKDCDPLLTQLHVLQKMQTAGMAEFAGCLSAVRNNTAEVLCAINTPIKGWYDRMFKLCFSCWLKLLFLLKSFLSLPMIG